MNPKPVRGPAYAITIACLFQSALALAGVNTWTLRGPAGPEVTALAIEPGNPSILFAGTRTAGVFKSTDGAASWLPANDGLPASIRALTFDSGTPPNLYAVTEDNRIFATGDRGGHWTAVTIPGAQRILSLVADPEAPKTLYAGTSNFCILIPGGCPGPAVFKSTDGGVTWLPSGNGIDVGDLFELAVDPTDPTTLYALSRLVGYRLYRSADGGADWTDLRPRFLLGAFNSIAVATNERTLYLAGPRYSTDAVYAAGSLGLWKSSNGGLSWSSTGLHQSINTLTVDPTNPSRLYAGDSAGVHRSSDGGHTWVAFQIDPLAPCRNVATLCLANGRFTVQADWRVPSQSMSGHGTAIPLSDDTGYFWFFNFDNVEMVVKVLDGCNINGHFWVFAGGLTNAAVTLTVTDRQTGEVRIYENPAGTAFLPIQDTAAFETCSSGPSASLTIMDAAAELLLAAKSEPRETPSQFVVWTEPPNVQGCTADPTALCLSGGRFQVQANWRAPSQGTSGQGTAVSLTSDTGYFWFFSASNVEMIVKVLEACTLNSHKWVFAGGLTNVEVTLTVTDMQTGTVRTYVNPADTAFLPIQVTAAFATCP